MKKILYSLGIFSSGFLIHSCYQFIKNRKKRVNSEVIETVLCKITNFAVHVLIKRYESKGKIKNQTSNLTSPLTSLSPINEKEETDFDNETLNMLLQIELTFLQKYHLKPNDYYEYLNSYQKDEKILKYITILNELVRSLQMRSLPNFFFGENFQKKYLEVICNIFYFNLKKTVKKYNKEMGLIRENNYGYEEKNEMFNNLYSSELKNTRKEIINLFHLNESEMSLSPKICLRIYPFYFSMEHPLRKKYDEISKDVNDFITYILNSDSQIDEFTNDESQNAKKPPIDDIIDFKRLFPHDDEKMIKPFKGETQYEYEWE